MKRSRLTGMIAKRPVFNLISLIENFFRYSMKGFILKACHESEE